LIACADNGKNKRVSNIKSNHIIHSVVGISLTLSCCDLLLFGGQLGVVRVWLVCMVRGHVAFYVGGSSREQVQGDLDNYTLSEQASNQNNLSFFSISPTLCQCSCGSRLFLSCLDLPGLIRLP
jgi:hypothetical protein